MRNITDPPERRQAALMPWYQLLFRWCLAWVTDEKSGKPNLKKAGEFMVGVTWTAYMWKHIFANDTIGVEEWMAYSGVLLTWTTVNLHLKRQADAAAAPSEPAP